MAKQYDLIIRLLGIGDSGVGKTSLICRFAEDTFTEPRKSTVGIDFKMKSVQIDGKRIRIQLWDTAGQERFETLTQHYYRRAQGIFLVYDITKDTSFTNLEKWIEEVKEYGPEKLEMLLLGNKSDMENFRQISTKAGQKFASKLKIPFFETSAKDSHNTEEAFLCLAKLILKKHKKDFDRIHLEREDSDGGEFVSELLREKKKSNCCEN